MRPRASGNEIAAATPWAQVAGVDTSEAIGRRHAKGTAPVPVVTLPESDVSLTCPNEPRATEFSRGGF
jgi:hypothetical protein